MPRFRSSLDEGLWQAIMIEASGTPIISANRKKRKKTRLAAIELHGHMHKRHTSRPWIDLDMIPEAIEIHSKGTPLTIVFATNWQDYNELLAAECSEWGGKSAILIKLKFKGGRFPWLFVWTNPSVIEAAQPAWQRN